MHIEGLLYVYINEYCRMINLYNVVVIVLDVSFERHITLQKNRFFSINKNLTN